MFCAIEINYSNLFDRIMLKNTGLMYSIQMLKTLYKKGVKLHENT